MCASDLLFDLIEFFDFMRDFFMRVERFECLRAFSMYECDVWI